MPVPKLQKDIKALVSKCLNQRLIFIPKLREEAYRAFFAYFLYRKYGLVRTYRAIKSYELIDMFLNNKEDDSIYDITANPLIILHGFAEVPNRQELNILTQVVDFHMTARDIYIYSHNSKSTDLQAMIKAKGFFIPT